ncbi:MAG: DUF368 domain-containing protein [Candidatus Omnitrophota bacterium]
MTQPKTYFSLFAKGFLIGIAGIIPGVSGGTIMFLTGIYQEIIEALYSFDRAFVKRVLQGNFSGAFANTGWKFLVAVSAGSLFAIFLLLGVFQWLLVHQRIYLYSFFFGLTVAAVFAISLKIRKGDFAKMAVGMAGAVAMYNLIGMIPIETPETWWFLFLSGTIAGCAMLLPGVSTAFILVLLGKYVYVATAVAEFNIGVIVILLPGLIAGFFAFARLIQWLLNHYHDLTLSFFAGLVVGSLRKIWPWKELTDISFTPSGNVFPTMEVNALPPPDIIAIMSVIVLFLFGAVIGFLFDRKGRFIKK